jgi:hypothetical protein
MTKFLTKLRVTFGRNTQPMVAQDQRGLEMRKLTTTALAIASATLLYACGGGSSSTPVAAPPPPPPAPTLLEGVVATGAALVGASVVVKDADATTADVTTTSSATGNYSADVSDLKPPFVVTATGVLNGDAVRIVAVVPTITSNSSNVVNLTSLTNAIAVLVAPGGDVFALNTPATLAANATSAKVNNASNLVVNTLRTDPELAAKLGAGFNPLTTAFAANGTGIDSVLDQLEIISNNAGVSIFNLAAPITANGAAATPVLLTAAQAATPNTVPTLPSSIAAGSLPTTAEMTALAKKYETCLALPVAQRVTMDNTGTVTAVSATCNYAPITWKSIGRNWVQELGQFTFAFDGFTGAKAGVPFVAAVFPATNYTGPTEFKHPVCNTSTCVVMNIPMTSASGRPFTSGWVVGKIAGAWDFVGNQRPYRVYVEQRLARKVAMNTALAASNPSNYNLKDRFESAIRLGFDLTVGPTAATDVRAVRWTGPGLPGAGVVQHRSQRCGTDDRMTITNQEGLLTINNALTGNQLWNNNGGNDFFVSAANLDGTPLTRPAPTSNWVTNASPSNQDMSAADVLTSIPAWSVYKAEIFYFSNSGTVADEIVYVRTDTPYEAASEGKNKSWPTLAESFATAYLTPTGANAASISSLAQTMSWTNPAGGYVGSSYLFAQNSISASNGTGDPATTYTRRTRLDFRPNAFGDGVAQGREFASAVAGTALSASTQTVDSNPNPRCTNPDLTPLQTSNFSYREAGLIYRGPDRKIYNAITFWSN